MAAIRKQQEIPETNQAMKQQQLPAEFNYHILRYALDTFGKNSARLNQEEYQSVYDKAIKSFELESLIIKSPEAEGVVISDKLVDDSFALVAERYDSRDDLVNDLALNSLDEASLRKALYRELLFDSIMQRVSAKVPDVSDVDIQLFYEMHRDRFDTPEKRLAYHILITVNPEYPENTPQAALKKMKDIAIKLDGRSDQFQDFAQRYSECPTAVEGGKLGDATQGQLYPELDAALFKMSENEISPIIETEMGLHLLMCKKIRPAKDVALSEVSDKIRTTLEQRNRHNFQKEWLSELKRVNSMNSTD